MPYIRCLTCGLASYSAAKYSGRDTCPHCASVLTRPPDSRERRVTEGVLAGAAYSAAREGRRQERASPHAR